MTTESNVSSRGGGGRKQKDEVRASDTRQGPSGTSGVGGPSAHNVCSVGVHGVVVTLPPGPHQPPTRARIHSPVMADAKLFSELSYPSTQGSRSRSAAHTP